MDLQSAVSIPSSLLSVSDKFTSIRQTTTTIEEEKTIPMHTSTGVRQTRPSLPFTAAGEV
jgi:hypothetical protein